MSDQRHFSKQLYKVLDDVGASETLRQIHKQTATLLAILQNISFNAILYQNVSVQVFGSRYEGSVTPDLESDIDIIYCLLEPLVVLDSATIPHGRFCLMIIEDLRYPGYVKLQIFNRPLTECDYAITEGARYDLMGRLCHKHVGTGNMRGPAKWSVDEDGVHYQDCVIAFKCDHIPDHANEWICRQRNHGWPSAEQIEAMSRMGCMFVGVGHWKSKDRDIEWRLSFSFQERLLMSSLNQVQHKVYIVLKMIKKNIVGHFIEGESLSSYHCKTCVFYAVEETPADFWTPDNLISCVLYCLRLLHNWVSVGYCPNYFIKDQNLFSKEGFMSVRYQLRYLLGKLVEIKHHFLHLLECDGISSFMRGGDVEKLRAAKTARKFKFIFKLKEIVIKCNIEAVYAILHKSKDLSDTLYKLQSADSINDHPKHETQEAINYLQPWLHLHIAKGLVVKAVDTRDRRIADMLWRRAYEHFHYAMGTDKTSVRMARASMLYTCGKYDECRELLEEIETFRCISCCACTHRIHINEQQNSDFNKLMSHITLASFVEQHQAHCVVFTRSESRIAPKALHYEMYRSLDTEPGSRDENKMFWFDFAVVDAPVYLFFLQYLVYEALQMDKHRQKAQDSIKAQIETCNKHRANTGKDILGHEETAYNLLGWIYLQQNKVGDALYNFAESLKIQPEHNAAKFHIKKDITPSLSNIIRALRQ